ncbi:MAG: hypothetical protein LUG50_05640 [Planctomycetaceae bacterium]|nr:hypothetical protein [Planctomycetaceae bacterium]
MKKLKQSDAVSYNDTSYSAKPVQRLFWSLEETASMLGLSPRSMYELRHQHALYAPDGSRTTKGDPKKDSPLWSDELIRLIAFARSKTLQGVRQLTDDEGLKIRKGMGDKKRREYLSYIDD